jgi:dipeptidyl aminopeptidase/acylaminoacyl peptidase
MQLRRFALLLLVVAFCATAAKRPLTHKDYDSWNSIHGYALSNDGHYLAYGLFPQEGDGAVVVRDLVTGKEWRENAGELPAPPPADPTSEEPPRPRNIKLSFTADSKTLVFVTYVKRGDLDQAKKDKKRPDEMPKGDLVVMDLGAAKASRVPQIKSYAVPEKGNGFVAYLKEVKPGERSTPANPIGTDLVLRNLADSQERTFPDVTEYLISKDAKTLAWTVASPKDETDGAFVLSTGGGEPRALLSGKGKYQKLTWNDKQDALAFISDRDDVQAKPAKFKLYLWQGKGDKAEEIVSTATPSFRAGYVISDKATLAFSKDGSTVFFGTAPPALPAPPPERRGAAAAIADDQPSFDLWHYKDDHVQPMQKVRATTDRNRSYRAAYHIGEHKLVQLADDTMTEATPNESGRYAFGSDDRAYRPMVEYGERLTDTYLIDTETGTRKLLTTKQLGTISWSPDGKYGLTFDGKDWITIAVPSGQSTNLTSKLPVKFWQEDTDTPSTPRAYGFAGWTKDGKSILLYDHFDIWQVSADGSAANNITAGAGRKQSLQFRYARLDPEERTIDASKPLLLRAENVITRDSGFFTASIEKKTAPEKLVMAAKDFGTPMKAKDADVLVLTEQTFDEFPDLMATNMSMKELRKVSDANPQKANLLWGKAEMIQFKNLDGVALEGALYKPENFDPNKKYPMIVYIYEKLSQNINKFVDPKPGHSIDFSYYVSNGYLIFTPDIVYTTGYPGQSSLKCVLAGVDAVVAKGFVDEKNIGIAGHSWGGYQIAYMVTQTTRFKAVEAGAPVANMTSAYDGIRWGSGLPRQFQYEKTQSRIGGTLWEYPLRFIENSPIFSADKIKTPILMLHNDADDAVPWYQGIEYYLALRRLGKEVYLFSYNGEPHHLDRRPNQKDYTIRMQQFFDYELKGAPEPEWMVKGIPYIERGTKKAVSDQ